MFFENNSPIYLQIMAYIKKNMALGIYAPDEKMPSTRDMAKLSGVNPNTIARAYSLLEQEGFLQTQRGLGTFVSAHVDTEALKKELAMAHIQQFLSAMQNLSFSNEALLQLLQEEMRRNAHGN